MDLQSPRPISTVRRNPPRRAKLTPAVNLFGPPAPSTATAAAAAAGITPLTLDDLLQPEPQPPKKPDEPENLKVFLRVRPLEIRPKPAKNPKPRPRGKLHPRSPKEAKEKSNKVCLVVNDSCSVTLTAPPSVFDSKRSKSEIYDGFSFVFPPESAQVRIL